MDADGMITVTETNFDANVRQAALPVLVDFWAPWCRPCGVLAEDLNALAQRVAGQLVIAQANVAQCRSLPRRLGVLFLPTVILFVDGREVGRIPGAPTPAELDDLVTLAGIPRSSSDGGAA